MKKEINQLKKEIENILNDNKALEVKSINLKDKTSIADFMIIASGNSSRHIQALSETLLDELKKRGISNYKGQKVLRTRPLKNVFKKFGDVGVIHNVDLQIEKGLFLGRNKIINGA